MAPWRRSREIRAFARAIRRWLGSIEAGSELAGRRAWAEEYAESIDPMAQRALTIAL